MRAIAHISHFSLVQFSIFRDWMMFIYILVIGPRTLPLDATNSARVTRIKPVTSSGLLGRPESPSLPSQSGGTGEGATVPEKSMPSRSRFYLEPSEASPSIVPQEMQLPAPMTSVTVSLSTPSSKKPRTSVKGAFKHGLGWVWLVIWRHEI